MRLLPVLATTLFSTALLATTAAPGQAQQRLRFGQRWQQQHAQPRFQRQRAENTTAARTLPPGTRVERNIQYGGDPKQAYDVYLPAQPRPNAPILFMVHGGGWRRGDKASPGVVGNKANYWLKQGFVFVSVNNRLVPEADPLNQARDVAAALASVQQHARQWGASSDKVVLMGHSAGAHLVDLLGSKPELMRQAGAQRPLGVVSLDSGALDVPALMGQRRVPQLYSDAFGADPAYWRSVSPQQQLTRGGVPMLLVCSSTRHFPTSPCDEAKKLKLRGDTLGVAIQILPEAMKHGEINANLGLPSAYTQAVSNWIDRALMQVSR